MFLEESILQGIIWKERDILFGMVAPETERVILLEVYSQTTKFLNCVVIYRHFSH